MRYDDARHQIRSGDLLMFRGHGLFAPLIRFVTRSAWAHCGVAWVIGERVMVLECRALNGVTMRSLSAAAPCDWISTGVVWGEAVETYALSRLQKPYSWLDAIKVGLHQRPSKHGQVCSTYAGQVLHAAGLSGAIEGLTPGALAKAFLDGGARITALT